MIEELLSRRQSLFASSQNQCKSEEIQTVLELHHSARRVFQTSDKHAFLEDVACVRAVRACDSDFFAEREDAGKLQIVTCGFIGRIDGVVGENGEGSTSLSVWNAWRRGR